jgi:hypothetical protein
MMSQRWAADDDILAGVGEALRSVGAAADPVQAAGMRVFACRGLGGSAPLAVISYDSLLDGAPVRDTMAHRTLEFEAAALSVEISVSESRLTGQLIPPALGSVEMITLAGAVGTATDDLGRFSLPVPRAGPVRFRCQCGAAEMITDWVRL